MLSCLFLVVQDTHSCIMSHCEDFSKIGGGVTKINKIVGGWQSWGFQSRGARNHVVHYCLWPLKAIVMKDCRRDLEFSLATLYFTVNYYLDYVIEYM